VFVRTFYILAFNFDKCSGTVCKIDNGDGEENDEKNDSIVTIITVDYCRIMPWLHGK